MITRSEAIAALERRKPVVLGTMLDDWSIVASYIDQQDAKLFIEISDSEEEFDIAKRNFLRCL